MCARLRPFRALKQMFCPCFPVSLAPWRDKKNKWHNLFTIWYHTPYTPHSKKKVPALVPRQVMRIYLLVPAAASVGGRG